MAAKDREPFWLCPACVQTVMEAHANATFRSVMKTAGLVTSDGMPLVWSLRLSGAKGGPR